MEFNVGIIQGETFQFASRTSWPTSKLTVEPAILVFNTGFVSVEFPKESIIRLSDYDGFCWLFARGIQVEHTVEKAPQFFVFWTFDLKGIKRSLAENGYVIIERAGD